MRKLICGILAIALLFTFSSLPPLKTVNAVSFSDVNSSYWAADEIGDLASDGILNGYPDGSFKPDNNVTRAEFAKIIGLALGFSPNLSASQKFPDVGTDHWSFGYVASAVDHGLVQGYPNGSYGPNRNVTKAEILTIIARAKNWSLGSGNHFADVPESYWAYSYIESCLARQVVLVSDPQIVFDNYFYPDNPATRAQTCVFVDRMMKAPTTEGEAPLPPSDLPPTASDHVFFDNFDSYSIRSLHQQGDWAELLTPGIHESPSWFVTSERSFSSPNSVQCQSSSNAFLSHPLPQPDEGDVAPAFGLSFYDASPPADDTDNASLHAFFGMDVFMHKLGYNPNVAIVDEAILDGDGNLLSNYTLNQWHTVRIAPGTAGGSLKFFVYLDGSKIGEAPVEYQDIARSLPMVIYLGTDPSSASSRYFFDDVWVDYINGMDFTVP
jgi:hypothetical protein